MNIASDFSQNPIIYHILTDRFLNTAPDRKPPYGRERYSNEIGSFFGGTFNGISQKIREGWFSLLGVNAILISAPYEQIHGWIPGGSGEFKHYAYHGYYAHDFTTVDKSYGSESDFANLVECAHSHGLLLILDIVINHPGYPDLLTFSQMGLSAVHSNWAVATPENYYDFLDKRDPSMNDWWGRDWIRSDVGDCDPGGIDDLTMTIYNLPDFKTEAGQFVEIPKFLSKKIGIGVKKERGMTVRDHLVGWLSEWVRKYGIDGFRCDSAKHVDLDTWKALKIKCQNALQEWRSQQIRPPVSTRPFWMVGEFYGAGIEKNEYSESCFDALLNFKFQLDIEKDIDEIYQSYAASHSNGSSHFVSFISSHDSFLYDRGRLVDAAKKLLLAPGGILLYYGDETAREGAIFDTVDTAQTTRSPMNWGDIDHDVLNHWRKICKFRSQHSSICTGLHRRRTQVPYSFSRFCPNSGDAVIIVFDVNCIINLTVDDIFLDGEVIRDAYTEKIYQVSNGSIKVDGKDLVLLERV